MCLSIDSHLPYQRVTTATDYDTDPAKFPIYWSLDGTDDSAYTTNPVDMHGSDKVTVVAGVTKLSDAATGMILESGPNAVSGVGRHYLVGPSANGSARYQFNSRGTSNTLSNTPYGYAAPDTHIIVGVGDIGGEYSGISVDGGPFNSSNVAQDDVAYSNEKKYMGARNDSSLFFNGRIYCLAEIPALLTPQEQATLTKWVASKQKRVLP